MRRRDVEQGEMPAATYRRRSRAHLRLVPGSRISVKGEGQQAGQSKGEDPQAGQRTGEIQRADQGKQDDRRVAP